jgi:hypothetical protein
VASICGRFLPVHDEVTNARHIQRVATQRPSWRGSLIGGQSCFPKGDDKANAARSPTSRVPRGSCGLSPGIPGAGKTFLIDRIADAYRADGYNVRAVLAANSPVDVLRR